MVHTLSPELGPILPRLGGLVSETGSVLAHLAIRPARTMYPTVVAHPDVSGFVDGVAVRVDGRSGAVTFTSATPRVVIVKGLAWLAAVATLVVRRVHGGVLARWEWSRALFFAVMFVATEVLPPPGRSWAA
ncbi:MAG: hypothetical protein IPG97_03080 [Microthrixaceae bacterium]|nr:hypothetical protein [Microthrixaceae bacterium]